VGPSGLPLDEASTLVDEAAGCLWGHGGESALAYLRGRGLTDETIRAAGLGFTFGVSIPTRAGDRCFRFSGIVIPWRDGARLTRIKIRRIDDGKPKYSEAYSDRPLIYPDPAVIRPGKPLIVSEGEFDCLLLGQQLPEASVITLGSASARTDPAVLSRMLSSPRWFIALDADQAGDSAASKFPASAIRVRPPDPDKDWGEVHAAGVNRIRFHWGRHLPMSKPIEIATLETPSLEDDPGPCALAEREAIQSEPPSIPAKPLTVSDLEQCSDEELDARIAAQIASEPIPDPTVWRSMVATWAIPKRQAWADRAESHQAAGKSWKEAEWLAFEATAGEEGYPPCTIPWEGPDPVPFPAWEDMITPAQMLAAQDANRTTWLRSQPPQRSTRTSQAAFLAGFPAP